jgi:hypothetical protein
MKESGHWIIGSLGDLMTSQVSNFGLAMAR